MNVCFVPSALAVFEAAIDFCVVLNLMVAERFRDRVLRSLGHLERFPQLGHAISECPDEPFREIIVEPYRFFYCVEGDTVWIIGVWHGSQLAAPPQRPSSAAAARFPHNLDGLGHGKTSLSTGQWLHREPKIQKSPSRNGFYDAPAEMAWNEVKSRTYVHFPTEGRVGDSSAGDHTVGAADSPE